MAFWADFYERLFNFREIRYFDIKGEYTGLTSRAMTAPDGKIRIPLNEEACKSTGQIEEFLMKFNGEGIQHVALLTDDLLASIDSLRLAGVPLMTAPNADLLRDARGASARPWRAGERLADARHPARWQYRGTARCACCCRSSPRRCSGPVFFEFIQRKGDEGFGEGNFKALFESLERDQLRRGVIKVEA